MPLADAQVVDQMFENDWQRLMAKVLVRSTRTCLRAILPPASAARPSQARSTAVSLARARKVASRARAAVQERFSQSFLTRECRAAGQTEEEGVDALRAIVRRHYASLVPAFTFYSCSVSSVRASCTETRRERARRGSGVLGGQGGSWMLRRSSKRGQCRDQRSRRQSARFARSGRSKPDACEAQGIGAQVPFFMGLNEFTAFLDECHIPDNESQGAKRSDLDTVFIVCTRKARRSWMHPRFTVPEANRFRSREQAAARG